MVGSPMTDTNEHDEAAREIAVEDQDPAHWKGDGWAARIIKNEDDDGWAVEMTRDGELEPALVGPWTMGRDKKNPKPLDASAFNTLVKTVNEVLRRHEHAAHAALHKSLSLLDDDGARLRVDLDIARDEDDPHAILSAWDEGSGEQLRSARVAPSYKLTLASAARFAATGQP